MNDKHIIEILDNAPLANLSESELQAIRGHAEKCEPCARAYEAAQLSALVIKERAADVIEPSPFFQTKVLATLRERQASDRMPAFARWWKSAGGLVTSMAATTAALAALTFFAPSTATEVGATAALIPSSAETVVLDQNQSDDQMTNDQVLNAIYVDDEAR